MNGIHDMGGMHGMGPIQHEENEPVFHAAWEGRVHALNTALRAWQRWSIDDDRHAIELLPPAEYLRMSYYQRWFARLVEQVVKHGFATRLEIESGKPDPGAARQTPPLTAAMSSRFLDRGIAPSHDPSVAPRFRVGQRVRAGNIHPAGHTRLPRYARDKVGAIERDHGVYIFPDTNAHSLGEKRQHVYSVRFAARDLWGQSASPRDSVHVDLWDDYLEPA